MEFFPDELTLEKCKLEINNNQYKLLKETRENFYNSIMDSVKICKKNVILEFDSRLFNDRRKIIITELVERFPELKIYAKHKEMISEWIIHNSDNLPDNIFKIEISFY